MREKIKFGIIGTGTISESHAQAIVRHPEAELAAVCDSEAAKAASFMNRFGALRYYSDYERMLTTGELDIVCVCVPSGLHAQITIAAAQAGVHVLCEKPLDINKSRMDAMIAECRARKIRLGVVFQMRTYPQAVAAKRTIQQGKLGKLVLGDAYMKYYRSPEYYVSAGWRGTRTLDGGGALMNQGVHGVDLIQWLMGDVASVVAHSAALVRDIEVEDTAVALLKYKNGAFGVLQGATSVYPAQSPRFEIHGEYGSIIFDDSKVHTWSFLDRSDNELASDVGGAPEHELLSPNRAAEDGHFIHIDDMIRSLKEDRDPMVTGEEARKSVDIILGIYESSLTGKEVVL